ncbi:MAG: excinuclease ABC subunit UvrA [bacterium]|nr:excinuclease ABC subunit UvrA [bacterium]MCP4741355.1 excinuclease ABC subunit UvrA [Actinomycetales bacterium]
MDCRIPLGRFTVVTGVSGSGKSTLAFDTLYAEGQRRYVMSLSAYARQFLERLPRPDVDFVSHLPPPVAIERCNRVTNARSTVGTATAILDHLRLLFAKLGVTVCPDCDVPVEPGTVEAVTGRILERFAAGRVSLGAPLPTGRGETATALRERLAREGFTRAIDADGAVRDVTELSARAVAALRRSGLSLIDRLALRGEQTRTRLSEAVALAFRRGAGHCVVVPEAGARAVYREGFACDGCGRSFGVLEPALFSFNHAAGACPACEGFGRAPALDFERVVPEPERSLARGAVAPFRTGRGQRWQARLMRACREQGIPVERPFEELSDAERAFVFAGAGRWRGVKGYFAGLERKRYRVGARVQIARYRTYVSCTECEGTRLRPEARSVHVGGCSIAELVRLPLAELAVWFEALSLTPAESERAGRLLRELCARVDTANAVGLGYVTLERTIRTLSGGEAQRIQLAAALGGTLTASLYVLDEPSIGLHPRDAGRLVDTLRAIRDHGNTVVVVEHDPAIIAAADHVIDLGPGGGRAGGHIVAEGSVAEICEHRESLTGRALRGELAAVRAGGREPQGKLRVVGARAHNLRDVSVDIPLGQLVAVTGVSGAGKTTLVRHVLVGGLRREPGRGECRAIEGIRSIGEVVLVDPVPPARSPRSNPATVSKAFDGIRARFAATREARALGVSPGWFSFNVAGGRCDACEGSGEVIVDMQFLDDVRMPCEMCSGLRYRQEVLQVRLEGLSIVDVLALGVDEACERFADDPKIEKRLRPLADAGLGYLSLGQPLSTLSGGEFQRLRLAQALVERGRGNLYVLDEPTTGLHAADVALLVDCLGRVIDAGASVIAVEHNLDVVRAADHVIDLGPDAGPYGGHVVGEGRPEEIARLDTPTGAALRAAVVG